MFTTAMSHLEIELARRIRELGLDAEQRTGPAGPELFLQWATHDGPQEVVVAVNEAPMPVTAAAYAASERSGTPPVLVGLAHASPATGRVLRERGIDYIDSGGNASVHLPGIHIEVEGRKPSVVAVAGTDRPSRAFRPAGLRVVFVWLVQPSLVSAPVRTVADAAMVSVGAVSNTINDLVQERLMVREARRKRVLTDPQRLMQRWLGHYVTDLLPTLTERRLVGPDPSWWAEQIHTWDGSDRPSLSGEAALSLMGFDIRPTTSTVYGTSPWHELIRRGRLTPGKEPNVSLRQRFWNPKYVESDGMSPPLLVYADALASGDSRQFEIAEQMWTSGEDLRRLS